MAPLDTLAVMEASLEALPRASSPTADAQTLASWLYMADGISAMSTRRPMGAHAQRRRLFPFEIHVVAIGLADLEGGDSITTTRASSPCGGCAEGPRRLAQLKRGRPDFGIRQERAGGRSWCRRLLPLVVAVRQPRDRTSLIDAGTSCRTWSRRRGLGIQTIRGCG